MARSGRLLRLAAIATLVFVCAGAAFAQFRRGGRSGPIRTPTPDTFEGSFNFCRIMFPSSRDGDGGNWSVDYPRADVNLSIRLAELTRTRVSVQPDGEPEHVVLSLTDPELFNCPIIMMTEVGSAYIGEEEARRLREYLQKGGFLWADDFWGSYAWENWASEFSKVLPPNEYPMRDLPRDHPLFRTQFTVDHVPQIPSINHWYNTGGTSEQGSDSAVPHALGVTDSKGRMLALVTFNTDLGDSWEREGDDKQYFYTFSVNGYAFGINALLYAMTH